MSEKNHDTKEKKGSILSDPALYIGLAFAILLAGQVTFFVVAFQQPDETIPREAIQDVPRP